MFINPGGVIPIQAVIKPKNKEVIKFIIKMRVSKKEKTSSNIKLFFNFESDICDCLINF